MKEKIKNNHRLMKILLVALVIVVIGVIFSCTSNKETGSASVDNSLVNTAEAESSFGESISASELLETESTSSVLICVHVCGAVEKPGVYFLEDGSRIHQAVELAGGLREDAADDYINLASTLVDGTQVYIPTKTEVEGGEVPALDRSIEQESEDDGLININTASLSELMTLPGIGESKAQAVIDYRENVAPFDKVEDIINVDGIKDSSYEKIKDYIKVQ